MKWIYLDSDGDLYDDYRCPACHRIITVDSHRVDDIGLTIEGLNFCPRCGADLRGSKNENE